MRSTGHVSFGKVFLPNRARYPEHQSTLRYCGWWHMRGINAHCVTVIGCAWHQCTLRYCVWLICGASMHTALLCVITYICVASMHTALLCVIRYAWHQCTLRYCDRICVASMHTALLCVINMRGINAHCVTVCEITWKWTKCDIILVQTPTQHFCHF
jgi:hypothetical protein